MYANNSEVSGNLSIGNHLRYAVMYSRGVQVRNNISIRDGKHGIMLNYANSSEVTGNLVVKGREKCLFIHNAHKNEITGNRFEGCPTGVHFTAGSERTGYTETPFSATGRR